MKYTYIGRIPTLLLVNGSLRTYSYGDDVVLNKAPSSDFILEKIVDKIDFSMPKVTKTKKKRE